MRSTNPFVDTIAPLIECSGLSQTEIARKLGYSNPNMITLFKTGRTRVPAGKVAPLAYLLDQDPGAMLRLWFSVYEPDVLPDLERHFGAPGIACVPLGPFPIVSLLGMGHVRTGT